MPKSDILPIAFTVHDAAEMPNILRTAVAHGFQPEPGASEPGVAWGSGTTETLDALWLLTGVATAERRLVRPA